MSDFKIKKTLHMRIVRLLIISIMLVAVLIGGTAIANAGMVVKKDSAQIMNLICLEKVQEIEYHLQTVKQSVDMIYHYADGKLTELENLMVTDYYLDSYCSRMYDVLKNAAESTECVTAVYIRFNPELYGSSTEGVYLGREDSGEFTDQQMTDILKYDPSNTEAVGWYYLPIEKGEATWIEPYIDHTNGVYMISYVAPLFRNGKPVAVIGMDMELSLLREIVAGISVYETGHAFVLSAEGVLIYHKDYPWGMQPDKFDAKLEKISSIVGPDGKEGEVNEFSWADERVQLVFHQLINGMYLAIVAPSGEIDAARDSLVVQCILIVALVLIGSVFFSVRMAVRMTKPITELTKAAKKIAAGDWKVEIPCDSEDETGVLAVTMKEMMTELNKQVEHVNQLAYTDMLTGLCNRHHMTRYCTEYVQGEAKDIGVIFCDLNCLKYMNDTYGHSAGDALITGFAEILKTSFPNDMCCRMSGDEFVVIIKDVTAEEMNVIVERLRIRSKEGERPLAAIGHCWKAQAKSIGEMLNAAEDDMYRDKQKFYEAFPMYKR